MMQRFRRSDVACASRLPSEGQDTWGGMRGARSGTQTPLWGICVPRVQRLMPLGRARTVAADVTGRTMITPTKIYFSKIKTSKSTSVDLGPESILREWDHGPRVDQGCPGEAELEVGIN